MGIKIIAHSATAAVLADIGPPAVPLSEPACTLRGLDVTIAERPACDTGLWECTPGRFQRQVEQGEVMHILAGTRCFSLPRRAACGKLWKRCASCT